MKSRLKRVALMSPDIMEKQIEQISDKGRDVLKAIEDYKFFIDQTSRVIKNDPNAAEIIERKKKNLDQASQQIYDVVFDIENMDITTLYYDQQQATELSKGPDKKPITGPTPLPGTPGVPNAPNSQPPVDQKPIPPQKPKEENDEEENKENKDSDSNDSKENKEEK